MNDFDVIGLGLGIEPPWRIVGQMLDTKVMPHVLRIRIKADCISGQGWPFTSSLFPCGPSPAKGIEAPQGDRPVEAQVCGSQTEKRRQTGQALHGELIKKEDKFRRLRKQLVDTLVNEILLAASLQGARVIAVEDLKRFEPPDWSKHYRRLFSMWFFRRLIKKLEEKGRLYGIRVVAVNPAGTSVRCARCGGKVEYEGIYGVCSGCGARLDRDVNTARNIALRGRRYLEAGTGGQPAGKRKRSAGVRVPRPIEPLPRTPLRPGGDSPRTNVLRAWFAMVWCAVLYRLSNEEEAVNKKNATVELTLSSFRKERKGSLFRVRDPSGWIPSHPFVVRESSLLDLFFSLKTLIFIAHHLLILRTT